MVTKLPLLFDIVSLSISRCLACSQWRAKSLPVPHWLCAISFSWCGKIRSSPPACRSKVSPRYFMLIAEHSMCQPGRPRPNGASHCAQAGSSLLSFQSTKSRAFSFSYLSVSTRAPAWIPAASSRGEAPVLRERGDPEVDRAVRRVGVAARGQALDESDHVRDVLGRPRHVLRPLHPQRLHVLLEAADVLRREAREVLARRLGLLDDAVVHVGHVHDLAHAVAEVRERAPQHVDRHEGPEVPDVRPVVDGGAAGVEAELGRVLRHERLDLAAQRVEQPDRRQHVAFRMRAVRSSLQPAGPAQASTALTSPASASLALAPARAASA